MRDLKSQKITAPRPANTRQLATIRDIMDGADVSLGAAGRGRSRASRIAKRVTGSYLCATARGIIMSGVTKRKNHPLSIRLPEGDIAIIELAADLRGRSRRHYGPQMKYLWKARRSA